MTIFLPRLQVANGSAQPFVTVQRLRNRAELCLLAMHKQRRHWQAHRIGRVSRLETQTDPCLEPPGQRDQSCIFREYAPPLNRIPNSRISRIALTTIGVPAL